MQKSVCDNPSLTAKSRVIRKIQMRTRLHHFAITEPCRHHREIAMPAPNSAAK